MGNTVRPIQPAPSQQATISSHDEYRANNSRANNTTIVGLTIVGLTIGLTIVASFINLRRSAVEVILEDKRARADFHFF